MPDSPPLPDFEVVEASITDLQAAMTAGRVTSRDLVAIYLERIRRYDREGPRLNAMICLNPRALEEATRLDAERATSGPRGPLHGIPVIIKDNYDTFDLPTTASCLALAGSVPPDDAFQVRRLREAGAVIVGKSNMHELAYGITCISSLGGQTHNPYKLGHNPGGSSGGTAAAVAASFAAFGMGSDTCGSIRIPAFHNSLVGLRPTLGLSSRDGIVPMSQSQDVAGPICRSVADLAIVLDATVGFDPADPVTAESAGHIPETYAFSLRIDALHAAKIGVLNALFGEEPEELEVGSIVRAALKDMAAEGASVIDVGIPELREMLIGSSVLTQEFKFAVDRYLAATPGAPLRTLHEIIESGLYHTAIEGSIKLAAAIESEGSEDYRQRLTQREALQAAIQKVIDENGLDAVAYPSIRRKAAPVGERQPGTNCSLSAQSGYPAISFPAGFTADRLPVGIELLGRRFGEGRLIALAYGFEQAKHRRRPPASAPSLSATPPSFPQPPAPRFDGRTFEVIAAGAEAVAPLDPAAFALGGRFSFDEASSELSYAITLSGATAEDVTGAYLHRAASGANGPIVAILSDRGFTEATGRVRLAEEDAAELKAGNLCVQVTSLVFPRKAARAQLPAQV